jgi:hypothetical protein
MVTDLQGKAIASGGGQSREIGILAELDAGTTVDLAAGARLVVLYLDAGDEYAFNGPVSIRFGAAAPQTSGGAPAERRGPALGSQGKDVRIKPVGVRLAAVVMRSVRPHVRIALVSPNYTWTLQTRPVFTWKAPEPGLRYAFELDDASGNAVVETEVEATSYALPASVRLAQGVSYTWRVSARLANGRKFSSDSEFVVATAELRAKAQELRPAATAPLSSRIVYAAWLDQVGLREEARTYWQAAAAERPDDAQLKSLAEE